MKKFLKLFLAIVLIFITLGIVFYLVDTTRVNNGEEPIFTFFHKIVDGVDYSKNIDIGLGYKIIRYDIEEEEIVKSGSIFMDEMLPDVEIGIDSVVNDSFVSGESGEEEKVKITTFGESYKDVVFIEGLEEQISVKEINSKLGYTMSYYYDLFEYTGFEDYDSYLWHLSSGEDKAIMTVYDISNEELYEESLEKIKKDDLFDEISGEANSIIKNVYYRAFEDDSIPKVNYIYLIELENLKFMVDLYYNQEASEGIGVYMNRMAKSIKNLNKD